MNNLSDSATKKRDLLSKTSDDASEFKWGFDAGYEVGSEEMNQQVQLLEDALKFYAQMGHWGTDISGIRTAIDPSDQCFGLDYADIRGGKRAKKALESLAKMRGGK